MARTRQAPQAPTQDQAPQAPTQDQAPQTLAQRATAVKAGKRKPVFVDVPGIDRVPLADGRVGCVQAEMLLQSDGTTTLGAWMLTIPRKNADGSESGARFPLAEVKLIADAYAARGESLV